MKSYTITVNGNVYQVTVEENTGAAPVPQAAAAAPTAPAPVPASVPAAPVPSAAAPAAAGGTPVEAPMMGKILDIKVSVGQAVKRGDSLFILEAMDGTVASINANKGDTVESGTVLATLN